jgi:hypothetical protein
MGVHYQTQAQGLVYTVTDDLQSTYAALVTSSLVDEVAGTPLQIEAVVTPDLPGVGVNMTDNALFALTGYAELVFPKLSTTAYVIHLQIVAPNYRPATVTVAVPAGSALPIVFRAINMRPLPVRLQGRVVRASDRSAIPGATMTSTDNSILLLRSPLYFDHLSGVTVNAFTFSPTGVACNLIAPVNAGSSTVFLNNNAGLAGQTLQIGSDPEAEVISVQTVGPAAGQVNLQNQLNSGFPANTPARPVNPSPVGTSAALARNSNAGDGLLVLAGPLAASGIQISDGARTESHLLNAITDSSGYYHLNGLTGVVSLDLSASAGGFTTSSTTMFLAYNDPVNVVDFRLK